MKNNYHITSKIITLLSLFTQFYIWYINYSNIYEYKIKIIYILIIPYYYTTTNFFYFYLFSVLLNIFYPKKWIFQNSKYISVINNYIDTSLNFSMENFENNNDVENNINNTNGNNDITNYKKIEENNIYEFNKCIDDDNIYKHYNYEEKYINDKTSLLKMYNENNNNENNNNENIIMTIQIPVYKEDFLITIKPTLENVLKFCKEHNLKYKKKINIFINDDGILSNEIDSHEIKNRIDYYNNNDDIFYICRSSKNRQGIFKKASNLNFCVKQYIGSKKNNLNYLSLINNFTYKENVDFHIGKYLMILDSDTRINENLLNSLILELENDDEIAYLQLRTGIFLSSTSKWEQIICYFTKNIYDVNFLIMCSNGFPPPLMGHNCILRFSILEKLVCTKNDLYDNLNDKLEINYNNFNIWNEDIVSEDFVLSIEMMINNYYGKYIYYDSGFQEGVTLNITDEINKFIKHTYGINQIVFYKFNEFLSKGIIKHQFINFIFSNNINFSTKFGIISYINTYYTFIISPFIYIIYLYLKIFNINSTFLINPNKVLVNIFILFYILNIILNISLKYDLKSLFKNFIYILKDEILYGFLLLSFFSGISYYLIKTTIIYFLNLNINICMTNKDKIENSTIINFIKKNIFMYIIFITFFTFTLLLSVFGIGKNIIWSYELVPLYIFIYGHLFFPLFFL